MARQNLAMPALGGKRMLTDSRCKAPEVGQSQQDNVSLQQVRSSFLRSAQGAGQAIIDGPFAEARELVAGFLIRDVKEDMEEVWAWAVRRPNRILSSAADVLPVQVRDVVLSAR